MTVPTIGFLVWPGTRAITLALADEALRVARRIHPEAAYDLQFFKVEDEEAAAPPGACPAACGTSVWKA